MKVLLLTSHSLERFWPPHQARKQNPTVATGIIVTGIIIIGIITTGYEHHRGYWAYRNGVQIFVPL